MKWLICVYAVVLSACVDIKVASTIPQTSYLSLNTFASSAQNHKPCNKTLKFALFDVYANAPYNNLNIYIFDTRSLQINTLSSKKWISQPADMLKLSLLSKAQEHCISLSLPPFGVQKFDKGIKLSLLSLQILQTQGKYKTQISVFYEILNMKSYQSKSGMLESLIDIDSLNDEHIAIGFAKAQDEVLKSLLKLL